MQYSVECFGNVLDKAKYGLLQNQTQLVKKIINKQTFFSDMPSFNSHKGVNSEMK